MQQKLDKNNLIINVKNGFSFSKEGLFLNIIRWGIYLSLFTPLVYVNLFYGSFVVPKTIFFRIVAGIILIAYILLVMHNRNYMPKGNALTAAVTVFVGVLFLTSLTGINFEKSFWGDFERMGGLITFFYLYAFFIVSGNALKRRKDWERVFSISIFVNVLVVIFAVISDQFSIQSGSTLNNSSFLASYLLFNIFFAIILLFIKNGWVKILYWTSIVILVMALFLSGGQGAIVAFIAGLFLLGVGYFIFFQRKNIKWAALAIILLSIISLSVVLVPGQNFVKNEIKTAIESPTVQARIVVWQIAWQGWKEKFLLGWGLENFDVPFYKYFDPRLSSNEYGNEIKFDRAHNIILDNGITSGLLGVLSYLAVFATSIFVILKKIIKSTDKSIIIYCGGVAVVLMVYFIQNLLVFDMISSYLIFFLILSFISYISNKKTSDIMTKGKTKNPVFLCGGIILIMLIVLTAYFGNIQPAKASLYVNKAMTSPLDDAILLFQKALRVFPQGRLEIDEKFSMKIVQSPMNEISKENFLTAIKELQLGINKNPLSFYSYLQLGTTYNLFFMFNEDVKTLDLAENVLKKAITISPRNQNGYMALATTKFLRGDHAEQLKLLRYAFNLEPHSEKFQQFYVISYKNIVRTDPEFVTDDLQYVQDFAIHSPQNIGAWIQLAIIYDYLGEKLKKEEAINKLEKLDPMLAGKITTGLNFLKIRN